MARRARVVTTTSSREHRDPMANFKMPRKLPVILLGALVLVVLIALLVGIDITASNF